MSIVLLLNLITSISILFVAAIGLAVIFGLMGVVNLAHGEFIMIGAFASYVISQSGLSPWFSFLLAPIVAAVVGLITERFLVRHLYGKIMESILATWGLGIVIRQVVEFIFGKDYKSVPMAVQSSIELFGTSYPAYRLLIIVFAVIIIALLLVVERKTNMGVTARAVIQNPELSSALGINVNRVYSYSFVTGTALAGLAGAIVAPLVSVFPGMGLNYVINAFLTVLVGGMGSLLGTAGSAGVLGGSEALVSYLYDPVWGSITIVIMTLIIMRFRKAAV